MGTSMKQHLRKWEMLGERNNENELCKNIISEINIGNFKNILNRKNPRLKLISLGFFIYLK